MNAWKRLDERLSAGRGRTLWQFVKFNLVSLTVTVILFTRIYRKKIKPLYEGQ